MLNNKKVYFIYGRHDVDYAPLYYIPVLVSFIKILQTKYKHIEIILLENEQNRKYYFFNENVKITFLGKHKIPGKFSGYSIHLFKCIVLLKFLGISSPSLLFLSGGFGIRFSKLARLFKKIRKITYFDDEFLWIPYRHIFTDKKAISLIQNCDVFVGLDAIRNKRVEEFYGIRLKNAFVLPNYPDNETANNVSDINWVDRLNLDANLKYVLFPSGYIHYNMFTEVLTTVPLWPEDYALILNGFTKDRTAYLMNKHLFNDRIIFSEDFLNENEYNSLVRFSHAVIGLYSFYDELEYVGMSSGKIMRSVSQYTPVIANNHKSLEFVEENNWGIIIKHPSELPEVLRRMDKSTFFKNRTASDNLFENSAHRILAFLESDNNAG